MTEVGRAAVRDPSALLPGGFWAAVAVWLERPQVANKRLCGVRLEARRGAVLPGTEARGPRPSAEPGREEPAAAGCGSEEGPGPGQRCPEGGSSPRPGAGPEEPPGTEELRDGKSERGAAAAAPLLAGAPGQPGEGAVPAPDLDSLWDDFSRSLAGDHRELLAFLAGPAPGLQAEAQHELDVALRTVIPKRSRRCPLGAPRREMVARGKGVSDGGRRPDQPAGADGARTDSHQSRTDSGRRPRWRQLLDLCLGCSGRGVVDAFCETHGSLSTGAGGS